MKKLSLKSIILSTIYAISLLVLFNTYRDLITGYLSNQYVDLYAGYLILIEPMNIVVMSLYIVSIILLTILTIYMWVLFKNNRDKSFIISIALHTTNSVFDLLMVVCLLTNLSNIFTGSIDILSIVMIIIMTLIIHVVIVLYDAYILLEKSSNNKLTPIKSYNNFLMIGISSIIFVIVGLLLTASSQLFQYSLCLYICVITSTSIFVRCIEQVIQYKHQKVYVILSILGIVISLSLVKVLELPIYIYLITYFIYGVINIVTYIYMKKKAEREYTMKVSEIVSATNGKLLCGNEKAQVSFFTQDSRKCVKDCMYIPIIGENNDGHNYIQSAFDNGASTIITDRETVDDTHNIILVKDTTIALGDMARYIRETRNVKVVGITGSVGKTSTKDMIYSVVSQKYKTLKTLGNYNNQIGLPLTILRHKDEEVLVLEMGMNHLREIAYLSNIAKPDIAAITNVGTAHIGEVGGRENILKAKMEITEGLKENGILVLNDDNDLLHTVNPSFNTIRVGENVDTFKPLNVSLDLLSSDFDIDYQGTLYHVHVPVPGAHFITNALIALAIGTSLDIDIKDCIKGIESFELTKNRMDLIQLNHNITLIDGTYNANVDSMKSSIDILASSRNRKIAVLGDMLELGEYEESLHKEVGNYLSNKVDVLLCVGNASKYIIDAAQNMSIKLHFDDNESLLKYIKENMKENDVILVKGSNGMHLKEIVEGLSND